MTSSRSLFH